MDEQQRFEAFLAALAEGRIKRNTDYALTSKYGQRRIMCHEVYKERVVALAREHSVEIMEIFTYS